MRYEYLRYMYVHISQSQDSLSVSVHNDRLARIYLRKVEKNDILGLSLR